MALHGKEWKKKLMLPTGLTAPFMVFKENGEVYKGDDDAYLFPKSLKFAGEKPS